MLNKAFLYFFANFFIGFDDFSKLSAKEEGICCETEISPNMGKNLAKNEGNPVQLAF